MTWLVQEEDVSSQHECVVQKMKAAPTPFEATSGTLGDNSCSFTCMIIMKAFRKPCLKIISPFTGGGHFLNAFLVTGWRLRGLGVVWSLILFGFAHD